MKTIREAMTERALAEYDAMVAEQARVIRATMLCAGCPRTEIEAYFEQCQPGLAEQRAAIPGNVSIALMKAGIPLEEPAHAWN